MIQGEWRTKPRPEALIFAGPHLLKGWTVMDRLGEIKVPTLVMAGRDDFLFPPEHQAQLAAGIPNARLRIIERAGHNPHSERPAEVMEALRDFLPARARPISACRQAGSGRGEVRTVRTIGLVSRPRDATRSRRRIATSSSARRSPP